MTPAELCEGSAAYVRDALAQVSEADLGLPTPCPGWNLRTLLLHLGESADLLSGSTEPRDPEPVEAAREGMERLLDTVRGAATDDAAYGGAIELVAHGWDVHAALGTGVPIPEDHAAAVLDLATTLIGDEARSQFFGPAVDPAVGASSSERLVAFLGRHP